jgi:membrane protease YdiL (CAAX protease family)
MAWLVWRMSQKSQPVCTLGSMAARLHLWPLPTRISKDTLNTLLLVFCLHFFGTAGMFAVQWASDKWIFGWANYWTSEKGWDHANIADMLFFAPLREELTFRGIMFSIFYLRGAAFKLATPSPVPAIAAEGDAAAASAPAPAPTASSAESLAWTSSWKRDCVFASTVTFGLVHALNLLGSRYTRTYVMLQIVLACLIGAFYCMRFVRSEHTMFEAVCLHVINNLFSSALPVEANLDLSSPLVTLPRQRNSTLIRVHTQWRKTTALMLCPLTFSFAFVLSLIVCLLFAS